MYYMEFDTKIKVILRNDLEAWQELNITAFLVSGIAGIQNRGTESCGNRCSRS